jgi:hypothetical protein
MTRAATSVLRQPVAVPASRSGQHPARHGPAGHRQSQSEPRTGIASVVGDVLHAPGQPLDPGARTFMETRFSRDFSTVRIHTDAQAARSAQALDARAYTVGSRIVFGQGQYRPATAEGNRLLAHELAHTVQQRHFTARAATSALRVGDERDRFEQEAETQAEAVMAHRPPDAWTPVPSPRVQRVSIFQKFARLIGFEGTFGDAELQDYLAFLDRNNRIEKDFDSDNKARAVVARWRGGAAAYRLTPRRKMLLIEEMIAGFTGDADEAAILDLLAGSPDSELTTILARVTPARIRDEIHGEERQQFDTILAGWRARTSTLGVRDALAGTHAVTPAQHAAVEATLTPGATVVVPPPPPMGGPAPAPVVVQPPAMTGAGVDGPFETAMRAALRTFLSARAASFRGLKAAGPPAFPIARAHGIAVAAQQQTESYFAPYIRVASRAPTDVYHPGSFALETTIGDQSTVPISDAGVVVGGVQRPGRLGWTEYWMKQTSSGGAAVLNTHHVIPTRSPDDAEFTRVRNRFATEAANRADIDDTIHGWPAEATGGVNIQPYTSGGTVADKRRDRWDVFTTLIHEMMHVLEHPNYRRTRDLIGGSAQEILKEGMPDVMRRDLWDGPGALKTRLATPALAPVRRQVEGSDYPYDASVVHYHADYPMAADARAIVHGGPNGPGVGMANAKAAFFMGHTELLGLGAGTATQGGASLAGTANYAATESADAEIFVVTAGVDYADVRSRTNATAGGIRDAATNNVLAAGAPVAPGTRLRVPGIRWVYSLREDTLADIARKNGVTEAALKRANFLPFPTPNSFRFAVGTRVLIPIH